MEPGDIGQLAVRLDFDHLCCGRRDRPAG
jgi:hypothetical protein